MNYFDRLYGQIAALTERAEHAEARAEKAEARVAELEAQVAAVPVVCFDCNTVGTIYDETDSAGVVRNRVCGRCGSSWQVDAKPLEIPPIPPGLRDRIPREPAKGEVWVPRTTYCLTHGAAYASETWGASFPPVLLGVSCLKCSWRSEPAFRTPQEQEDGLTAWLFDAKTAPKAPVPAPEGTETVQKAPPPSPVGAPRGDQGAEIKTDTENRSGFLGDPRGFGLPPQRGLTAEEAAAYTELLGNATTRVEASPAPTGPGRWEGLVASEYPPIKFRHEPHGPGTACVVCDNTDPRIKFRVEASPAAAAEVEARTGAYIMQSGGVVTISAIDGVIVEVRHPRAGLPSRDEVAAFLEGLDSHGPWTCRCGKTYQIFDECGVCGAKRRATTVRANVRDVRIHK